MHIAGIISTAHLNPYCLNGTICGPQNLFSLSKNNRPSLKAQFFFYIDTATFYDNLVYQSSKHPKHDHLKNYKVLKRTCLFCCRLI